MVAKYKRKRLIQKDCLDSSPKHVNLEKSERLRAKSEIKQGLDDYKDQTNLNIQAEIEWEEEIRQASWCYEQEKSDPNYVCRCFEKK